MPRKHRVAGFTYSSVNLAFGNGLISRPHFTAAQLTRAYLSLTNHSIDWNNGRYFHRRNQQDVLRSTRRSPL